MVQQQPLQTFHAHPNRLIMLVDEHIHGASEYHLHQHHWGQMIFVDRGVITLEIEQERFISPPGFAIWIPPHANHTCYSQKTTRFRSINICEAEASKLPQCPSLITLSPIAKAIIDDFFAREIYLPTSDRDFRRSRVFIDELQDAMIGHTYLPNSDHKLLKPILSALELDPAIRLTLKEWASKTFTTERTLARYFKKELGMSFSEWCARLRFIHATSLLEKGDTVEEIAFSVGYRSASSFIAMFQNIAGTTPDRYRQAHNHTQSKTSP